MNDAPLIKRFLQHQSDFMSYLMAITRDFDAAEEVFQNAALVVIEKSSDGEEIRDFRAWAKEIVRRQALHYMRKSIQTHKRTPAVEPAMLDQITRVFLEEVTTADQRQAELRALRRCLQEVPEPQRDMLTMRYEQRASFTDIASRINKTEAAVQRALSRVRRSLHDCVRFKLLAEGV